MSLFIGKNHIHLASVDSTNNYARQLLSDGKPVEGTLISAENQLNGRGQAGNTWTAEAGKNLTLSVILYPNFLEADKQFFLNMAICLAVKDFCEEVLQEDIKIKWPNDIYFEDEKLGGILIENTVSGSKLSTSVVGIGLNVMQTKFPESVPNACSFVKIKPEQYSIDSLQESLCSYLEKYYLQLRQLHFNFLDKAYMVSLYRYQQTQEFRRGKQTFKGEIVGVAKDGKLLIQSGEKEMRFAFKEVEFVI